MKWRVKDASGVKHAGRVFFVLKMHIGLGRNGLRAIGLISTRRSSRGGNPR
jgi:hypothetical protein